MKTRVAIYGFGRLGRAVYAVAAKRRDLEVVMVATDKSADYVVRALMSDAIYDAFNAGVQKVPGGFLHEERHVELRPVKTESLWKDHAIDIVIDTMTAKPSVTAVERHQNAGARKVVFAAPSDEIPTVMYGVNDDGVATATSAVSGGGPEQAAAAPVIDMIANEWGIESLLTTTVDGALCSCQNGECTTEHVDGEPLPLDARLQAPKLLTSMTEVVAYTKRALSPVKARNAVEAAVKDSYYQGIISLSDEAILPDDVLGDSVSAIIDMTKTVVSGGRLISLKLWYDREWGYANRLVELTADFGKQKEKSNAK